MAISVFQRLTSIPGAKDANYHVSPSTSELAKPGLCALANVSISGGKIINAGASFVRGNKDTPVSITNSRPYELQVGAASDMHVLFYDTESQKGWLLDGASALLHISRAWLSSKHARLVPKEATEHFSHPSNLDGRDSAFTGLTACENRELRLFSLKRWTTETVQDSSTSRPVKVEKSKETWWCWEELVQLKWNVLEQIHDHTVRLRTSPPTELRIPFTDKPLEGFDFYDILSDHSQIRPRMVELQSTSGSWVNFITQNDTINIFGSGFGDLIQPASPLNAQYVNCSQIAPVPSGFDYLTVPYYVLKDIALKHRKCKDGLILLGESIYWTDPDLCLSQCDCAHNQSHGCNVSLSKLQSLPVSVRKRKSTLTQQAFFAARLLGAAVFGNRPNLLTKRGNGKRKLEAAANGIPVRNTRPRGSDSGIDIGPSSTSSNSRSPNDTQQSSNDSGIQSVSSV